MKYPAGAWWGPVALVSACLLAAVSLPPRAAATDFPVPANIRPAIDFWARVYTEVDTGSGLLHDAEDLSVVYASLPRDRDTINRRRKEIIADLQVLASGKRAGLTASQRRIVALWPADVSNKRLARAAGNVRWQLGQSDRFLAGLKRSGAYRDHIEAVVRAKGMPIELAALPHVESSFHPGAYSSAAATGMWQFVRSTAQRFMRVDQVVDERLDPYAATYAAMDLLEYNYNALGTWPLALTAYNHGVNGMTRAVKETGSTDIGNIIARYKGRYFGFASRNFYPQFLAVLEVEKRAEEIFGPVELDRHPEFVEVEMADYVNATVLARSLGVNFNDLRRDNPALQPAVWSGTKRVPKGYRLKIQRSSLAGDLALAMANIPSTARFNEQIPDVSYTVRRGDSLSVIARRYRASVNELVAINQLRDRHRIRIGQVLLLPQPAGAAPILLADNSGTAWEIPDDGNYEVRRGDTLSSISDRFRVPVETLLALNSLDNRNVIYPGQTLTLTGVGSRKQPEPSGASAEEVETAAAALPEPVEEDAGDLPAVAGERDETDEALETGSPQLAQLSIDSGDPALEVDADMQDAEARRQLLADLASDPSDYSVTADYTIEIQAAETLGHYADWLGIRAWDLRRLNGMVYGQPVITGRRLKLDFSQVDVATFERKRREYHRGLQAGYFDNWRIKGTEKYRIQNRDLLVNLIRDRSVPLWLFRQYNPDMDPSRLSIGQEVAFPLVEKVEI